MNEMIQISKEQYEHLLQSEAVFVELKESFITLKNSYDLLQFNYDKLIKLLQGKKQERHHGLDLGESGLLFSLPQAVASEVKMEKITIEREKKKEKPKRIADGKRIPEFIPRITTEILPLEDMTGCARIGEEVTEQLQYKAPELYVERTVRPKFARPNNEGIAIAELPEQFNPKGIFGSTVAAKLIEDKYVYHLPLDRQAKQLAQMGLTAALSTISDTTKYGINQLLPLYNRIVTSFFESDYIMMDETILKVLDKNKKGETHQGYIWGQYAPIKKIPLFIYEKSRGKAAPAERLKDYKGYLQSDGYEVYESIGRDNEHIMLVGCMAHARRKFIEARNSHPLIANTVLDEFGKLYALERKWRESEDGSFEERRKMRQEKSKKILEDLKLYLEDISLKEPPKSPIGRAAYYMLSRWTVFLRYLEDGKIEIDNNLIENKIRPIALGRKNYLFAGDHEAAQRTAIAYTFAAMCKIHEINFNEWLCDVFKRIPSHPINRIEELLPNKNFFEKKDM